jgi:DNA-binding winged helix-turn-helix (wHTH) protein/tetratricopeptide (TPR) repeat protein
MPPCSYGRYSFSVFCFDSRTGTLYRNGYRLRITKQAREVLAALLENAGSVVTREELQQQLWPGGEYLDWGHSINNVVAQLRAALRDDVRETRFIETAPKRGYRFIAQVSFEPEGATTEAPAQQPELEQAADLSPLGSMHSDVSDESVEVRQSKSDGAPDVTPEPASPALHPNNPFWRRAAAIAALVMLIGALTTLIVLHFAKREPSPDISLGIPPFEVYGDASNALAESFRLEVTSAVAELPRVQVRAAHSLNAVLRDDQSIRATAKSMELDLLLFGKLMRSGDQYVLQLEVVRGGDAVHLASFRYSGSSQDLGIVRERIQRDLFDRLRLAERGAKWRTQASTPNPKAYQAYLQARLDLSRWADAPVQKALEEFEGAIHEDPSFANAYSGLASAYVLLAEHGAAPRESSYRQAQAAAEKAIQLAPATAEAHAILGQTALRQDWNFETAERELRRAIELDQSRALYHLWLSVLLCEQSRFDDSLHEIDLARAADPLWAPVYWTEAATAGNAGQFARSIQAAEKLTELMPNWPPAYDQRGWAYWFAGREADAIADWRHMAQMENDTARMRLEDEGLEALRRGGVPAYARLRLKAIQSGDSYHHASSDFSPAEWYSIAGEYDKALSEVEQMMARHDPDALQFAVNRTLLPLHNQPRFVAALIRIGLNQPKPRASAQIRVRPVPAAARPLESRERADLLR